MRVSTPVVIASLLGYAQLGLATPPACLLAALGVQPNPADMKAVCGTLQSQVESNLTHACSGDSLKSAYGVYSATCQSAGVTVAALPSATSTASSTDSSGTATGTGSASTPSTSNKNSAPSIAPRPFVFAASGLLVTTLTGVLFL